MTRSDFLKLLCVSPLSYYAMKLNSLNTLSNNLPIVSEMMPVLFLGHGSPMNAIEENEFVRGFREIGKTIPKPKVILVVS
ncbi:MAG: 4,5-DOPA dioxygenase extradiol, partial [Bacteroidia bacterium]|nr:4,5-DOPA dioxygenase extradiol [Bacteroidia bacterium]